MSIWDMLPASYKFFIVMGVIFTIAATVILFGLIIYWTVLKIPDPQPKGRTIDMRHYEHSGIYNRQGKIYKEGGR